MPKAQPGTKKSVKKKVVPLRRNPPKIEPTRDVPPEDRSNLTGWFFVWSKQLRDFKPEGPVLRYLENGKSYLCVPRRGILPESLCMGDVLQYDRIQPVIFPD